MGGGDFTWLASGQILKVGGNTRLQVELCNRSDLHTLRPGRAPDFPRARSAGWASSSRPAPRDGGPAERCGASRSCDSALGWGHGSFPLLSLVWGAARRGAEAQTRSGGRGASTVQDAHRWRAEVMRLVVGPGAGPLAQEAGRPHFESKLLRRVPKVAEHDVHYGHLLHPRCVDLQHRLLVALPHLRAGEAGGVGGLPGHAPLVVPLCSPLSGHPQQSLGFVTDPFVGSRNGTSQGQLGWGWGKVGDLVRRALLLRGDYPLALPRPSTASPPPTEPAGPASAGPAAVMRGKSTSHTCLGEPALGDEPREHPGRLCTWRRLRAWDAPDLAPLGAQPRTLGPRRRPTRHLQRAASRAAGWPLARHPEWGWSPQQPLPVGAGLGLGAGLWRTDVTRTESEIEM